MNSINLPTAVAERLAKADHEPVETYLMTSALAYAGIERGSSFSSTQGYRLDCYLRACLDLIANGALRAHVGKQLKTLRASLFYDCGVDLTSMDSGVVEQLSELSGSVRSIYDVVVGTGLDARVVDVTELRRVAAQLEQNQPISHIGEAPEASRAMRVAARLLRALATQAERG